MNGAVLCRAKVNLTLHVGAAIGSGRWAGYHPVESLVAFADFGDRLSFAPDAELSVSVSGPFGKGLAAVSDNLVIRAMRAAKAANHRVHMDKCIPISAGLGGGSANAAGALRVFDPEGQVDDAALGADVPVCRLSRTAMMEGIGERVTPLPGLGTVPAVLVNPGVAVSTARIFQTFDLLPREAEPARTDRDGDLLARAYSGRNDLQNAAIGEAPVIADVLDALNAEDGCDLARMSGSGATCFGLFRTDADAQQAARRLTGKGWWGVACRLGDAD